MTAQQKRTEERYCPRGAAEILDTKPVGLRALIRRAGAHFAWIYGIRAKTTARNRLIVFLSDFWRLGGKVVRWVRLPAAAVRLRKSALAVRRELERKKKRTPDGWVSTYNGLPARQLGRLWLLCFEQQLSETASSQVGEAQ